MYFLQLTWSLGFKDQEELTEFARIIALSKLATTNMNANSTKQHGGGPFESTKIQQNSKREDSNKQKNGKK